MQEELLKKERRRNENVLKNALANLKSRAAKPKEQQEQYSKVHAKSDKVSQVLVLENPPNQIVKKFLTQKLMANSPQKIYGKYFQSPSLETSLQKIAGKLRIWKICSKNTNQSQAAKLRRIQLGCQARMVIGQPGEIVWPMRRREEILRKFWKASSRIWDPYNC